MSDRVDPFEWAGGHPALDLVNTLDERPSASPIERLATYRDLVTFVELAGLIEPRVASRLRRLGGHACSRALARTRELREHLHDVLAAANFGRPAQESDLHAISAVVRAAHAARGLVASGKTEFVEYCWRAPSACDIALHACSLAIERLLVDEQRDRIRKCGASDCDVYFIDTSKGRLRHWCSMKGCGNREKQRRWRFSTP